MGAMSYARLPARPLFGVARFHAIAPPRVSSRPPASHSVPQRGPPTAVPHQAKRRKRPVFTLFFAVLAVAPPARIELATLALGKPRSHALPPHLAKTTAPGPTKWNPGPSTYPATA